MNKPPGPPRSVLRGWILAGGTGLALQLGHRVSRDFDFFHVRDPFLYLPQPYRFFGVADPRDIGLMKSLVWFDDAEKEPMPRLLQPFSWAECRAFFLREAHALIL